MPALGEEARERALYMEEVNEEVKKEEEEDDPYEGDAEEEDDYISYSSQLKSPECKQISVDPVSLKHLTNVGGNPSSSPAPPGLRPLAKPKFISASLPCSTTGSPRSSLAPSKSFKKWRVPDQNYHPSLHSLGSQHSAALSHLLRSKSCGEGRACSPSDEFDILSGQPIFHPPENGVRVLYDCRDDISNNSKEPEEPDANVKEGFKCGALCLFLPGLSKKKQAQANHDEYENQGGVVSRVVSLEKVSRVASLEKFECGSWSESAILDDEDDGGVHSYFDLPLELINSGTNDAESPVKAAFVFDRDRKGVLKKSTSRLAPRKSHEASNRHVRFSTSNIKSQPPSPSSCITPRLLRAREEFNALLEAQGA